MTILSHYFGFQVAMVGDVEWQGSKRQKRRLGSHNPLMSHQASPPSSTKLETQPLAHRPLGNM
jgi:hypothetical protein